MLCHHLRLTPKDLTTAMMVLQQCMLNPNQAVIRTHTVRDPCVPALPQRPCVTPARRTLAASCDR